MVMSTIDKRYIALLKRFPLAPIKNKSELKIAGQLIVELAEKFDVLKPAERDYFEILAGIIKTYEEKVYPGRETFSGPEILESLMEDNALSQSDIAKAIGAPRSRISEYLSGKRDLSKAQIVRLADRFKVSPALFLPKFVAA